MSYLWLRVCLVNAAPQAQPPSLLMAQHRLLWAKRCAQHCCAAAAAAAGAQRSCHPTMTSAIRRDGLQGCTCYLWVLGWTVSGALCACIKPSTQMCTPRHAACAGLFASMAPCFSAAAPPATCGPTASTWCAPFGGIQALSFCWLFHPTNVNQGCFPWRCLRTAAS